MTDITHSPQPPPPPTEIAAVFGPTFGDEVIAAGLGGLPFSWGSDGSFFGRENLSAEQNARLDAVIAAHDPTRTPVPEIISHRQLYEASAVKGVITRDEALEAVRHGTVPEKIAVEVAKLPPDDQFHMNMLLSGAGEFNRHHPAVDQVGHLLGLDDNEMDDIWRLGATL